MDRDNASSGDPRAPNRGRGMRRQCGYGVMVGRGRTHLGRARTEQVSGPSDCSMRSGSVRCVEWEGRAGPLGGLGDPAEWSVQGRAELGRVRPGPSG